MPKQNTVDIGEVFKKQIKIEQHVMAIETLFNNQRRFDSTNYKPPYQRNYVWNEEKASYFIESILLGTEIPPLIFFNSGEIREVVDGRQRYETIYRFVTNQFKLRKAGLLIFKDLAGKLFSDLNELKNIIWDTKLRIIEFGFHNKPESDFDIEDVVKKEIFKRYNTGITPLTSTEIDKAIYDDDNLNSYIKEYLQKDKLFFELMVKTFSFDNNNIEVILKKIRQLLVQHKIPISYYATEKLEIINKFYDILADEIDTTKNVSKVINDFVAKVNYLMDIKNLLEIRKVSPNVLRLIVDCLFWAISILENEDINLNKIDNIDFKEKIVLYLLKNITAYKTDRHSFNEQILERYNTTALFFEKELNINYRDYVRNNDEFKKINRSLSKSKTDSTALSKFESLRLNKPDAVSCSIEDLSRQITRQRFMLRPTYQRNEVINKKKSSAIIESILLGIKLPPIFIYKRVNGVSEVIDGQQRLLSILGFLGKEYLDENKVLSKSDKDMFALDLKSGILTDLDRKKFTNLEKNFQNKIIDYNLWIIEISQKNNPEFDPIDLYIRLNNKPYPIKENTFEMWNSYISRNVIENIKEIYNRNKDWFYFRKNNSRMENENIYTCLAYLNYIVKKSKGNKEEINKQLDIYKTVDKINFRLKSKTEVTRVLENSLSISQFITASEDFEYTFLKKLKQLLTDQEDNSNITINRNLDEILNSQKGKRTQQGFYALWFFIYEIPNEIISAKKLEIRISLKDLFIKMGAVDSRQRFDDELKLFKEIYGNEKSNDTIIKNNIQNDFYPCLKDLTVVTSGMSINNFDKLTSIPTRTPIFYFEKGKIDNYIFKSDKPLYILIEDEKNLKEHLDIRQKILLKKHIDRNDRFTIAFCDYPSIFGLDFVTIIPSSYSFLPKYIFAVLMSRMTYFTYHQITKDHSSKFVSVLAIKEIPVPVKSDEIQEIVVTIVDFILTSNNQNEILFYERLIDIINYEIFMYDVLKYANCLVLDRLRDFLKKCKEELLVINSFEIYRILSDSSSWLSGIFLRILSINEIKEIEGAIL